MFITTHAVLGALVGERFADQPVVAFTFGVASHFIADIIPHGDSNLYKGFVAGSKVKRAIAYVTIDSVVAIFFVLFLFNTKFFAVRDGITWGIVGGVLPDMLVAIYELTKAPFLKWFHKLHFFFHNLITSRKGDLTFPSGFAMQLILLAAILSRVL